MKQQIEWVPIGEVIPYENNPRKNEKAIDVVAKSIKEFGFQNPIIVDKDNIIIAGHTRLSAAIKLEFKEVPIIKAPTLTDAQVKAYRIMDNKSSENAEWEKDLLAKEFEWLEQKSEIDLELTGFKTREISEIWDFKKEINEDVIAVDAYERAKNRTKIRIGDIYLLGEHRLMCGDSTEKRQVDKLMDGEKAELLLTDPPYGINVVSKKGTIGKGVLAKEGKYEKVLGDGEYFDIKFLLKIGKNQIIFGANYFHDVLPLRTKWLVWDKDRPDGTTFGDCELIWTNREGICIKKYKCTWNGMVREGESGKRTHPTQKPIKLLSDILKDYSNGDDVILDLFGGSGSTLIACEQLDRKCFMMELDPVYCQVIIDRWEKLTGKKAEKLNTQEAK